MHQHSFTTGGLFRYDVGTAYFGAAVGGDWGNGTSTDTVLSSTGSFNTHGFTAVGMFGNVFTLWNGVATAPRRMLATKGRPKPADGYSVKLDLRGYVGYTKEQADGYTDSVGFVWGAEQVRFWGYGGSATLYATVPCGSLMWKPFVAVTVDSMFDFKHTLDIPAQTLAIADTVYYGSAQTFVGTRAGIEAVDARAWRYGLEGYYRASSEFDVAGGRAYVAVPFSLEGWLSRSPTLALPPL